VAARRGSRQAFKASEGGAYVSPAAGRVTLAEYAAEWLASKHKLKASTRARYQVTLDTLIAAHANIAIGDITRAAVRDWVSDLSVDSAPSTVHNEIGVCDRCSRWLSMRTGSWSIRLTASSYRP